MKKQVARKTIRPVTSARVLGSAELGAVAGGAGAHNNPLYSAGTHADASPYSGTHRTTHPNHNATRMSLS